MKIGLIQYSPAWEGPEKNINKIEEIVKNVTDEELLIFPEMTLTGFTMSSEKFAEEIDGTGTTFFISLAAKLKKHIFAGIIERDGNKIFNTLVHFDKNGLIVNRYRKIHLFTIADEQNHYSPGKENVTTEIERKKIGLSVCYDLRFPEFYRYYAKERVDLIVNIASWPIKRIDHWKTLLKARAIENQCFVAAVNRVGEDIFQNYPGASCIFDPFGEEILLIENEEGLFAADIDFSKIEKIREKLNFLNDIKLI